MTRSEIEFIATASARYHRRRAAFLERVSAGMSATNLLGGAGAFVAVVGSAGTVAKFAALVIILVSIVQIVFQTDRCANEHRHWLRAWNGILREVHLNPEPDAAMLRKWVEQRFAIESECVAEMRALANDSWNRTLTELDRVGEPYKLSRWQRLMMQLHSFENAK
jgi:hypothetical protein